MIYRDLWPGIDLIWRGESGRLKQLFRIRPGADPRQIGLIYRGALALAIRPGADPRQIGLIYRGALALAIEPGAACW